MPTNLDDLLAQTLPDEPSSSGRQLLPGGLLSQGFEVENEAITREGESYTRQLSDLYMQYHTAATAIHSSKEFTPVGKRQRSIALAKDMLKKIDALRIEQYGESAAQQIEESLQKKSHKEAAATAAGYDGYTIRDMIQYWKEREIRKSLGDKLQDPVVLNALYLEAVEAGNELLVSAIENAPIPRLSAEMLTKGRELQLMRKNPEAAEKLSDIRAAQTYLCNAVAGIKKQIMDHTGFEPQSVAHGGESGGDASA
jgi:hypothetical protein